MDGIGEFHTFKGYQANEKGDITPAMEDYLEMICRLLKTRDVVRIGELAQMLNVKPSSVSKMIQQLAAAGYVEFEKYSYVRLTERGCIEGEYLLYRHEIIHSFLCLLNESETELEQVERIEHFLNRKTVLNLAALTEKLKG